MLIRVLIILYRAFITIAFIILSDVILYCDVERVESVSTFNVEIFRKYKLS